MSDVKVYVEEPIPESGQFGIHDDFIDHYVTTVRRLNRGDPLEVAGDNYVAETVLTEIDPVTVDIKSVRPVHKPEYNLTLYQAITRKKKFEETVKRGTELGVTGFVPLITERTVRVPNNLEKQRRRWRKIAMDSARISERDELPEIVLPTELNTLDLDSVSRGYLADSDGTPIDEVFDATTDVSSLFVGPEGGFTDTERTRLRESLEESVRVGSRNLRAETASIALISGWMDRTGHF